MFRLFSGFPVKLYIYSTKLSVIMEGECHIVKFEPEVILNERSMMRQKMCE